MALPIARDDFRSTADPSADALPLLRASPEYEMTELYARNSTPEATEHNIAGNESGSAEDHRDSTSIEPSSPPGTKPAYWVPFSLTWTYLISLAILSISLAICCFALVVASRRHLGIANAGTTGEFEFMRRFLPTILAVLYTLTWTPVAADVTRTEPWALLSRPFGSTARDSLLKRDRMWWGHIADAARSKKRLGGFRWALLISIVASLIASVVINPLSAGLFDTAHITITDERQFLGADASALSAEPLRIGDAIYLRAAVNLLFDVSTSAWNTDEFNVAPFWPTQLDNPPFSAALAISPSIWIAEQDVTSVQVHCEPFSAVVNSTEPYDNTYWKGLPFLQTKSGCGVIYAELAPNEHGGGVWAKISNATSQTTYQTCKAQGFDEFFLFHTPNATSDALMHDGEWSKRYYTGQVCSSGYVRARIPVTVTNTLTSSTISVDKNLFLDVQQPIDDRVFNTTKFESEFISQTGATHLRPTAGTGWNLGADANSNYEGPSFVLAASQNYSIERLMSADPAELAKQAGVIKQRFMDEVFLASFKDSVGKNATRSMRGSMIQEQSRLVVDLGVGLTMGVVFVLLSCAAFSLAFLVRPQQRPLHIYDDPNEVSASAFALKNSAALSSFNNLDRANVTELSSTLDDRMFSVDEGKLVQLETETVSVEASSKSSHSSKQEGATHKRWRMAKSATANHDWRPFTLRVQAGLLLGATLACVMAALASIYAVSQQRPLHQAAFVYSSDITLGKLNVTTLAPYSIIPALVAVGIKLWWGTIDGTHRRLAPFLAMIDASSAKSLRSPKTSYITTPIVWVTFLAIRRRHWLLVVVTLGAFVSEILQVSMAALWTRELGVLDYNVELERKYELRSLPHVFSGVQHYLRSATTIAYPGVAKHLYGGELFQTSWMYGSLAELAFGAQPPAWSKDGWSFPPVALEDISKLIPDLPKPKMSNASRPLNVTMVSQGLRGRLACTVINDRDRWTNELTNTTRLKPYVNSLNETGPILRSGFEYSSSVRVANFSAFNDSRPDFANIGQWLHFNYSSNDTLGNPLYNPSSSQNFTVLWTNSSYPHLYQPATGSGDVLFAAPARQVFSERPQVQAIDCQPSFETSKARITVNAETGQIYALQLLEDVHEAANAWSNSFERHFSNETEYYYNYGTGVNDVREFNSTVSWGYLFHLAVLQACNAQGFVRPDGTPINEGYAGSTPFSLIETDLYSDPYSYAALALVDYDRQALLDATTLTNVTQRVFSTFFQWFVSAKSGFKDDYWAYQPIGATLPSDLDFGATESTVTSTMTSSRASTLCVTSWSTYSELYEGSMWTGSVEKCVRPTSTSYTRWTNTMTYTTITRATSVSSTQYPNVNSTTGIDSSATITPTASLNKRVTATDTPSNNMINAEVSVHTETLVISPVAVFLSIVILVVLIISTAIIYVVQRKQLSHLPRDFDCPASLLAAVYASAKLQDWSEQQHKRRPENVGGMMWKKSRDETPEDEVAAKMGYFRGVDGKEHWGIELEGDHASLMTDARPGFHDVRLQETEDVPDRLGEAAVTERMTLVKPGQTDVRDHEVGSVPRH